VIYTYNNKQCVFNSRYMHNDLLKTQEITSHRKTIKHKQLHIVSSSAGSNRILNIFFGNNQIRKSNYRSIHKFELAVYNRKVTNVYW